MQGRYQDAMNAALELENFYAPHYEEMPELEYYIPAPLYVMFRFHKWNEILALQAPNPNIKMTSVLWLLARAVAYASLGRVDEAKSEQQKYLALEQEIPKDYVWGFNKAEKIFAITNPLLDGKIAEAQNQQDKAIEYLRQAVAAQDELNYNEPPDWFFPVRESLGGLLLKNKQYAEAEQVFRKDLVKHPRNGWALYGLLESLKGQNKTTDVYWVEGEYNQVWSHADVPLTIQSL
jgi:tetratricopeptide (TPR) repeat protein